MSVTPNLQSVLPRLPMSKALVALLRERLGEKWDVALSSIPVKPDANDPEVLKQVPPPYGIVYPLYVAAMSGTWSHPAADATWVYQVSLFALRGDQLEWGRDKVMAAVLGRDPDGTFTHPLDIEGMSVMGRWLEDDGGADPDIQTGILPSDLRFALAVTPTA